MAELEKLKLYVHPNHEVIPQHVNDLVSFGLVSHVFALSQELGLRNYQKAISLFDKMTEQGESPIKLHALVVSHFRKLILVKENERMPADQLARAVGIPPFFTRDYLAQCRKFTLSQLQVIYKELLSLAIAMRSSGASPTTAFASFIQKTCLAA